MFVTVVDETPNRWPRSALEDPSQGFIRVMRKSSCWERARFGPNFLGVLLNFFTFVDITLDGPFQYFTFPACPFTKENIKCSSDWDTRELLHKFISVQVLVILFLWWSGLTNFKLGCKFTYFKRQNFNLHLSSLFVHYNKGCFCVYYWVAVVSVHSLVVAQYREYPVFYGWHVMWPVAQ